MGKRGTWGKAFLPHRPVCPLSRCFLRPGWNTGLVPVPAAGTARTARACDMHAPGSRPLLVVLL